MPRGKKKVVEEDEPMEVVEDEPVEDHGDAENKPDFLSAVAQAWDEVKGDDDAPFANCAPSHKATLYYHAEGVLKTSAVQQGDSSLARFERAFQKIIGG